MSNDEFTKKVIGFAVGLIVSTFLILAISYEIFKVVSGRRLRTDVEQNPHEDTNTGLDTRDLGSMNTDHSIRDDSAFCSSRTLTITVSSTASEGTYSNSYSSNSSGSQHDQDDEVDQTLQNVEGCEADMQGQTIQFPEMAEPWNSSCLKA
mmetsp:Transcript_25807/g.56951  ORF Transcript_25807/g.56951 Transcript_25807/m.56951 type:complete len:150 (+) Transcript_25807:58-507(+)